MVAGELVRFEDFDLPACLLPTVCGGKTRDSSAGDDRSPRLHS
jgi:hypothetical protein